MIRCGLRGGENEGMRCGHRVRGKRERKTNRKGDDGVQEERKTGSLE